MFKICSDKNKPNGQFELASDRATIVRFMRDLPVRKIPGFGRVTERCLEGLEIEVRVFLSCYFGLPLIIIEDLRKYL